MNAANRLTHLDESGAARMVDISPKAVTLREATASASVAMAAGTLDMIMVGRAEKGDVLATARLAGIMAAKRTSELIPLCHPLAISKVSVELAAVRPNRLVITATVAVTDRTGVEMEALTAAAVAALTVYDMCKAVDRGMVIGNIQLEEKTGGRSGHWKRKES